MSNNAAVTQTTNIVPVQGIFDPEPTFALISLIGPAGTPFYANISPNQSGLNITNSTINSTTIGATTPSTGAFTSGTVTAAPTAPTDIANKQYVDYYAAGLSWKQPVNAATTTNITLSGLQTIDTVSLVAGNTVLVKNQSTAANNGIYTVAAGTWTRSPGADTWDEYVGAIVFVLSGSQTGTAWFCTAQPGGTLGVTAINWSNFSVASSYTAGTGLTLAGTQFSITPVGTAGTYGSASSVPVFVTNASGQVTSVTNTAIAIANTAVSGLGTMSTQNANAVTITGGTINGTTVGATTAAAVTGTTITANTQFTGPGTGLTGTASSLSIGGNAATATNATTSTNLAGGTAGSLPYQSATSTTTFLAAGTNGQILTLAAGVPSWANAPATGVTTFSAGTTGFTPSSATSGAVTLAGTLNVANGGTGVTTSTGSGSVVLSTSPTLVTPVLGTPTSGNFSTGTFTWPTFNQNTTGTASNVTGVVAIANGGTNGTATPTAGAVSYGTGTAYAFTAAGTAGQVLTSNGSSAPSWSTITSGITITDDTTTNATRYLTFTSATTGSITGANVASTKLSFNPSTGNVGIGTSSPASQLQVNAPNTTAESLTFGATAGQIFRNENSELALGLSSNSPYNFYLQGRTNTNTARDLIIQPLGGNVGIGTSSPSGILEVVGTGSAAARNWAYIRGGNVGATNPNAAFAAGIAIATNFSSGNSETNIVWGQTVGAGQYLSFSKWNGTTVTEQIRIDSSANLQFNSGYGSVATAYGCRAWVNFNGTGTVAIRASGNVSSITDNGTGQYTVNFITAMPDANYCFQVNAQDQNNGMGVPTAQADPTRTIAAGSLPILYNYPTDQQYYDATAMTVAIFR